MLSFCPSSCFLTYLLANLVVRFDVELALLGEIGNVVNLPAGRVVIDADVGGPAGEVASGTDDARGAGGRAAQDGEAGGEHGCSAGNAMTQAGRKKNFCGYDEIGDGQTTLLAS